MKTTGFTGRSPAVGPLLAEEGGWGQVPSDTNASYSTPDTPFISILLVSPGVTCTVHFCASYRNQNKQILIDLRLEWRRKSSLSCFKQCAIP
jgi:hypothetical protein